MANAPEVTNMALFCDFENIALGVRDAKYDQFDIGKVLERLLLKGSIVVKKAYCDWDRYKAFKAPMHEASFELIEIPHVRQSGKNSADIRMVVDALDLCYTKSHVDTFVIISGDSDFSPLVSKLRENNKVVIGVGVKNSTSDLLIANCDEFIFYDDLVREQKKARVAQGRRQRRQPGPEAQKKAPKRPAADAADASGASGTAAGSEADDAGRQQEAIDLIVETVEALVVRARRRREDLGIDGQAGAEARASPASTNRITAFARSTACSRRPTARRQPSSSSATKSPAAISCGSPRTRNECDAFASLQDADRRSWRSRSAVAGHRIGAPSPISRLPSPGERTTYAPASLLGHAGGDHDHHTARRRVQARDDLSRRAGWRRLLAGVAPDDTVRFVASDGFVATLPGRAAARDRGDGARRVPRDRAGRRAVAAAQGRSGGASAGPFYLVWLRPERARITPEQWPYQVARIEAVAPLAMRYPMLCPRRCRRTTRSGAASPCSRRTARSATR